MCPLVDRPATEVPVVHSYPACSGECAVPSDAEICKAKAAEFRKAAEIANPEIKGMYLELAARWLEVSAAYDALEKSGRSDPPPQ